MKKDKASIVITFIGIIVITFNLFQGAYQQIKWNSIIDRPYISRVAFDSNFNNLGNKPTIPAAQINTNWNSVSGLSQLTNKPTLATIATTGVYSDLTGKPTIPSAQVNSDWSTSSGITQVLNKPSLARVATDSDYTHLSNKPTIQNITYYNASGTLSAPTKKWIGLITPNTGNGYSVDISSASFASVMSINVIAVKNTSTTTSCPNITVKTLSTTAVTFNITEGNSSLVSLLGSGVLLGVATVFANTTGLTFYVEVTGN